MRNARGSSLRKLSLPDFEYRGRLLMMKNAGVLQRGNFHFLILLREKNKTTTRSTALQMEKTSNKKKTSWQKLGRHASRRVRSV